MRYDSHPRKKPLLEERWESRCTLVWPARVVAHQGVSPLNLNFISHTTSLSSQKEDGASSQKEDGASSIECSDTDNIIRVEGPKRSIIKLFSVRGQTSKLKQSLHCHPRYSRENPFLEEPLRLIRH